MLKYALLMILVARVVSAQDAPTTPWLTDVKVARETALKQEKPCVIILHVNSGALWGLIKNVEAVLLSSEDIKKVCGIAVVVALKRDDKACDQLKTEFNIPWKNSHVVVLDGKGEILASYLGDTAGKGCTKESAAKFAGMFVAKIAECLKRTESVQELERRFEKDPVDEKSFDALKIRAEEINGFNRLVQLCSKVAGNNELSKEVKDSVRIKTMLVRPFDRASFIKQGEKDRYSEDCEKLLVELADHKDVGKLIQALFNHGYCERFDVPTKSEQGIERLKKLVESAEKNEAALNVINQLEKIRKDWIEKTESEFKSAKNEYSKIRYAAFLGDADTTIDLVSESKYKNNYAFQQFLKDAKAKKEKSEKSSK